MNKGPRTPDPAERAPRGDQRFAREGHPHRSVDPVRPWLGRPPWASASLSGNLLAGIERQLAGEAGSASGYIMPTPDVGDRGQEGADADEEEDPLTMLRGDLAAAGGRTVLAPITAAGFGAGPGAAPSKDYKPERFGFAPSETAVETRRDAERSILAACGVPPVLANHAAPGTSMREAWRQNDGRDRRAARHHHQRPVVRGARREGLPDDAACGGRGDPSKGRAVAHGCWHDYRTGPRGCRSMTASGCDHSAAQAWPCGEGVTRWRWPDCGFAWVTPAIQPSRRPGAAA